MAGSVGEETALAHSQPQLPSLPHHGDQSQGLPNRGLHTCTCSFKGEWGEKGVVHVHVIFQLMRVGKTMKIAFCLCMIKTQTLEKDMVKQHKPNPKAAIYFSKKNELHMYMHSNRLLS